MSTPETTGTARRLAPRDPETFFKAQERNRRATWRMSALCLVAAFLMGMPLTLVLTPFLYAPEMCLENEQAGHFRLQPPRAGTVLDIKETTSSSSDFGPRHCS